MQKRGTCSNQTKEQPCPRDAVRFHCLCEPCRIAYHGYDLPCIDYPQTRNLMETKVSQIEDDTAPATLTGAQMLDIRTRALTAAVSSVGDKTLPEIAHAAGCFL